MEWLTTVGQYASAIAAVLGVLGALVYKPIKAVMDRYKADVTKSNEADALILDKLNKLDHKVSSLTDDVQRIEGDRLAQKHRYYCDRGYASPEEKRDVCKWYESYTAKGGNHLTPQYMDDIMRLPEEAHRNG